MLEKFKTKELIWISLVTALGFVLAIFTLTASTAIGNPALGGLMAMFLAPLLIALIYLPVKKFGSIILFGLIFSFLSVPTPMITQTPGFHKVPIILVAVIVGEIIYFFVKNDKYKSVFGGVGMTVSLWIMLLITFPMLGLPAAERFLKMAAPLTIIAGILGAIGGYIGYLIYKKIENKLFIKQLQS